MFCVHPQWIHLYLLSPANLYLLFHSYHQDTMGRGDKSKKYGSRDVEGSTSGSRNSKGGSTPPPPPSKSGNYSKSVEYTCRSPPLPSAPPLVLKSHSSAPRTTRSYPNRNSKNSDETSISLDTDAPPLGNLEVKRIKKKKSSHECIFFLTSTYIMYACRTSLTTCCRSCL